MNIFIFDSKVTDHVGRLASYSHYLFLFLCRLHQKLQLTKHLWLKSHHEYIFILASIEYVTWLVSKIFEYVDNVKCYCDRILNCKGFLNTAAIFVKVIKKKLSCIIMAEHSRTFWELVCQSPEPSPFPAGVFVLKSLRSF